MFSLWKFFKLSPPSQWITYDTNTHTLYGLLFSKNPASFQWVGSSPQGPRTHYKCCVLDFSTVKSQSLILWSTLLLVQIHGMLTLGCYEELSLIVSPLGMCGIGLTSPKFNLCSNTSGHSSWVKWGTLDFFSMSNWNKQTVIYVEIIIRLLECLVEKVDGDNSLKMCCLIKLSIWLDLELPYTWVCLWRYFQNSLTEERRFTLSVGTTIP